MKIITISREFSSGGREIGKRLAEELGFDYYDREILTTIAEKCDVNEDYAEYILQHNFPASAPITMGRSFYTPSVIQTAQINLMREQTDAIKDIAKRNRDFVIVGRNADIILSEYNPFNIFVCADYKSKIERIRSKAGPDEELSDKQLRKKIKKIDKNRQKSREMISDSKWGSRRAYHLTVNTSGWEIKKLTPLVAAFARSWFDTEHKDSKS